MVLLWHHACGPGLAFGKRDLIELSALFTDTHKYTCGALRVVGEIAAAALGHRIIQGTLEPARLLSWTDLEDPAPAGGMLRFGIDENILGRLEPRKPYAKVDLAALRALS